MRSRAILGPHRTLLVLLALLPVMPCAVVPEGVTCSLTTPPPPLSLLRPPGFRKRDKRGTVGSRVPDGVFVCGQGGGNT